MPRGYGQYCPLSLAVELLCQRWTMLVLSRLLDGCTTFNEIHRGIPRISPSLLSKRLGELEQAGLVKRLARGGGRGHHYELTEAGLALDDIVDQLAVWGQHWARDMNLDDLDPAFLAWSMHLRLNTDALPAGRTVLQFEFSGTPTDCRHFWLVVEDNKVDMCLKHPGFETDLKIESDMRLFVECWRGIRDLRGQLRIGRIRLTGPTALRRALPDVLMLSALAPYGRRRPGDERRLHRRYARARP